MNISDCILDINKYPTLLADIEKLLEEDERVIIAIDGRCASGKSTLAAALAKRFDGALFHLDDYFLRPEQRTEERLTQIGGNVDYERFKSEILDPVCSGATLLEYTPFNCKLWALGEPVEAPCGKLIVIEGAYSHHPYFGDYMAYRVFLTLDSGDQLERIAKRNGEQMLERFKNEWIPMEEKYFEAFNIAQKSDIIINTSN